MPRLAPLAATLLMAATPLAAQDIVVSSKIDTEGGLLGNVILLALENAGLPVQNRLQLGGTPIVRDALLSAQIDNPLHLGVTEAGPLRTGTIKSAIGMGSMLWAGIGDTIRVSLAADPVEEIKVGFDILKSLGLRHRGVNIIACPSCARQGFDVIATVEALEKRLEHIKTPMSLSIIGCVVNGPGEALYTDIGFTGGGKGAGMIYLNGKIAHKQANDGMIDEIVGLVEAKAAELDAARAGQARALEPAE